MAVNLKHSQSGLIKNVPTGISFTTFFFGIFVHAIRGHWGPAFVTWFSFGLANIYYFFVGNKGYTKHLLERGFKPATQADSDKLKTMGIILDESVTEHASIAV